MKRTATGLLLHLATAAATLLFMTCTQSIGTGGGTTDTGNAKMAAIIHTTRGGRAAAAEVTICPADYIPSANPDSNDDKTARVITTFTDDTGYFHIDTIDPGLYSIEINDNSSGALLLAVSVASDTDTTVTVNDTLHSYSILEGDVGATDDTTFKRYLVLYGLRRRIPVDHDGIFRISDLPAGSFHCRVISDKNDWTPVDFENVVTYSDSTVTISVNDTGDPAIDTLTITLNTTESGAEVAGDVYGFPILLRLSEEHLPSTADHDGMRFLKHDGTALPFEIELLDTVNKDALIWVRMDTVFGNDSTQSFLMLQGDVGNVADANKPVFDTADGFTGSYHLNGSLGDATANGFDGVDHGTKECEDGIIGKARSFNGSSQYFSLGDLPDRKSGTISCWLRPAVTTGPSTATTQGIWGKMDAGNNNFNMSLQGYDFYAGSGSAGKLITKLEDRDSGYYLASATDEFSADKWYHVAWCWGDGGDSLYINGVLESSGPNSVTLTGSAPEEVGRCSFDSDNIAGGGPLYFNGTLDEFRIDHFCRNGHWIKLCRMNQLPESSFVTVSERN